MIPAKIIMTRKVFSRTESGKSWKSKPEEITTKEIDYQHYQNFTSDDTVKFFRRIGGSETVIRNYTAYGYIPVEIISCNPDRTIRKVTSFQFN